MLRDADVLRALAQAGVAADAGIGPDAFFLRLVRLQERLALLDDILVAGIRGQERVAGAVEDLEVAGNVHAGRARHAVGAGRARRRRPCTGSGPWT